VDTIWDTLRRMQAEIDSLKAGIGTGLAGTDQTIKGSHDRLDALLGAGKTAVPVCVVYNNANISVPDNSFTALTFNTEITDTDTMHDVAVNSGRITFTTAGLYAYGYSILFDTGNGARAVRVYLNGSSIIWPYTRLQASSGYGGLSSAGIRVFSAADYIECQAYQVTGGALNVLYIALATPVFWAAKIG
jgi:hypothetical protein